MALHGKNLRELREACAVADGSASSSSCRWPPSPTSSSRGGTPTSSCSTEAPRSPPPRLADVILPPLPSKRRSSGGRPTALPSPEFSVEGGTFAEQVMVTLTCEQGLQLRYLVEKLPEEEDSAERGRHTQLVIDGLLYRRPFVLDEYGTYVVHAMCTREDRDFQVSEVVSQRFVIRPTDVVPLRGAKLAELPGQMVRGLFRFAGTTTKAIAPRLETVRRAIANAAKTVESRVCVHLKVDSKKKGKLSSGVEVSFSVQVARGEDAQAMERGITDPSLVEKVADLTGLPCRKVVVEAQARSLEGVLLHLAWTFPSGGSRDYLDGSAMVYAEDRLLDVVDYRGAQSVHKSSSSSASCEWSVGRGRDATILHSGDVMSRSGGRHAIYVQLSDLPQIVTEVFFTLSAYYCRNLSKFVAPRVCFFDAVDTRHLLTEYQVADAGCASAAVVCSLQRDRSGGSSGGSAGTWSVVAYGQTCDGTVRDYSPIEAAIAPVQAKYDNWRRREPLVLLSALWDAGRALPKGSARREDVTIPLLEIERDLFRHAVSFL